MSNLRQPDALLFSALFNERGILALLVVTQVVAIILALAPNITAEVWYNLAVNSLFLHTTALVSSYLLYLARHTLPRYPIWLQLSCFILTYTLNAGLFSALFASLIFTLEPLEPLVLFVISNMFIVFLLTMLVVQFLLIHYEKEKQTQALSRAELDALQARIRPHFLYNSLNTAAELTHYDSAAAEQAILAIAALSQAAMQAGKSVALQDELNLSKQYISIESWRFGPRLHVEWHIPTELPDITIPCLTLQPLLENAILHGVEPSQNAATIKVEIHLTANYLTIIVTNPVAEQPDNYRAHNGMALGNIRQRLNIFYRHKAKLTVAQKNNIFRVKLVLPKYVASEK